MEEPDVCRICRSEATPEEPLFHPCKCSGSIQYVHQDCLLEWLNHTTSLRGLKAQCDLCKAPYHLRKRFRNSMPGILSILDYIKYFGVFVKRQSVPAYHLLRAISLAGSLSLIVDFVLVTMLTYSERPITMVDAVSSQLKRLVYEDPDKCGDSHASYLDYVLGFVMRKSCVRTSIIHGLLVIVSIMVLIVVLWIIAVWVLNEEAVRHDIDHILRGEVAHMDHGDEEELFEFLSDGHNGEGNDENAPASDSEGEDTNANDNVRYVPPTEEVIPGLAEAPLDDFEPINTEDQETAVIRVGSVRGSGIREKLVYFLPPGIKMDPNQPWSDLIDPDALELPKGFTREGLRKLVAEARASENRREHATTAAYAVANASRLLRASREDTFNDDYIENDFVEDDFMGNDFMEPETSETEPAETETVDQLGRRTFICDEAILKDYNPMCSDEEVAESYRRSRYRSDPFALDRIFDPYNNELDYEAIFRGDARAPERQLDDSSREDAQENPRNVYKNSSEEYLYSLGSYDAVTFYDDAPNETPAAEAQSNKKDAKTGRAILEPPADLYVDTDDGLREVLQRWQENEEDEELGLFFRQILGLFQRRNWETFFAYLNIVVLVCVLLTVYALFYRVTLASFRLFCLGIGVLLEERPLSAWTKRYPELLQLVLAGYQFTPSNVSERLLVQVSMSALAIICARYTVLVYMKILLKWNTGRQLVTTLYEFFVVLKTLVMTLIECLIFPEFCGALLHVVCVPLAAPKSDGALMSFVQSGIEWHNYHYQQHLGWTLFLQWLGGYTYMHGLQLMVAACRKYLRQGVIFFLHDTDALYFLRAMLLVSLPRQIYRIAISAGLYGLIIVLGSGSTTLLLRFLQPSTWPLNLTYLPGASILRMWWTLLFLRVFFVSFEGGRGLEGQPRSYKYIICKLWLRERLWLRIFEESSRLLDLQSWFFSVPHEPSDEVRRALSKGDTHLGYYVRAPYEKQLKSRLRLKLFVPVDDQDRRLDGKRGVLDKELKTYTVVWRPPHFKARLAGVALITWMSISTVTLSFTLIPLAVGRTLDLLMWNSEIKNDLLLWVGGLFIMLPVYGKLMMMFPPREIASSNRFKMAKDSGLPWRPYEDMKIRVWTSVQMGVFMVALAAFIWPPSFLSQFSAARYGGVNLLAEPFWLPVSAQFTETFNYMFLRITTWILVQAVNVFLLVLADLGIFTFARNYVSYVLHLCLLQGLVEAQRYIRTGKADISTAVIGLACLYTDWSESAAAKKLRLSVRESLYLDRIEVVNYEPSS